MNKAYEISLELYASTVLNTDIRYTSGDAMTMPLCIRLLCGGEPFVPEQGSIACLSFENTLGVRWPRLAQIGDDGVIVYELEPPDIAIPGPVLVTVAIICGTKKLSWPEFRFTANEGALPCCHAPPEYFAPWITDVMQMLSDHDLRISLLESGGGEQIRTAVLEMLACEDDIDVLLEQLLT